MLRPSSAWAANMASTLRQAVLSRSPAASLPTSQASLAPPGRVHLPCSSFINRRALFGQSPCSALEQPWWHHLALSLPPPSSAGSRRCSTGFLASSSSWGSGIRSLASRAAAPDAGAAAAEGEEEGAAEGQGSEEEQGAEEGGRVKIKALTKQVKHIMNILNHEAAQKLKAERGLPDLRPGDVVAMKVVVPENKRRVSLLRGIVIARHNAGINSTFRIRRIMAGVGVEIVFPLYSPNIRELKVVDKRRARRAKLYYLRDKIARLSTVN